MQDDALIGSLTVRENLLFAALLKLGREFTWAQKIKRVRAIVADGDSKFTWLTVRACCRSTRSLRSLV